MSKIRVLHIANNVEYKENPISRAFRNYNCVVQEVDFVDLMQNKKYNISSIGSHIVRCIEAFKPNFVFMQVQHAGVINMATAREMAQRCPVISWTGDVREDISWHIEMAQAGVLTLFSNLEDIATMAGLGHRSDFLQVGFDETIHRPLISTAETQKIVFIGNKQDGFPLSKEREQLVIRLKKEFGNDFQVYGKGWNAIGIEASPIKESDCSKVYSNCLIAINHSHFYRKRYTSNRMFYAMAAGAFCLTHYFPCIEYDFEIGSDLDVYTSIDDLVDKCYFYIAENNNNKRNQIAKKGYNYVVHNYTWDAIVFSFFARLKQYYPNAMNQNDNWIPTLSTMRPTPVFSQRGEEFYIGQIFNFIGTNDKYFVDLGAGDGFKLSNTALLKRDYGWKGVMIDADNQGNNDVQQEFITGTNICELLYKYGVNEKFDLLSIDLDGNDYWILDKLLNQFRPRLIVAEFNGTIPIGVDKVMAYNEAHTWGNDDYYGASLDAFKRLAKSHNYTAIFAHDSLNVYLLADEELENPQSDFGVTYVPQQYHKHNPNGKWEVFN